MSDKNKDSKVKGKGKPDDGKIKTSSTDSKDSVFAESTVEKTVAADKNSNASNNVGHIEDLLAGNATASNKSFSKESATGSTDTGSRSKNFDAGRQSKRSWKDKKFRNKQKSNGGTSATGSNGGDHKNVGSSKNAGNSDALGEVSLRISNRTISEVAQPNAQDLALLGMDNFSSDSIITLREGVIRTERYASSKTGNIGDTIQQESEITDISKIE